MLVKPFSNQHAGELLVGSEWVVKGYSLEIWVLYMYICAQCQHAGRERIIMP